jgi:hypothetical protein
VPVAVPGLAAWREAAVHTLATVVLALVVDILEAAALALGQVPAAHILEAAVLTVERELVVDTLAAAALAQARGLAVDMLEAWLQALAQVWIPWRVAAASVARMEALAPARIPSPAAYLRPSVCAG